MYIARKFGERVLHFLYCNLPLLLVYFLECVLFNKKKKINNFGKWTVKPINFYVNLLKTQWKKQIELNEDVFSTDLCVKV